MLLSHFLEKKKCDSPVKYYCPLAGVDTAGINVFFKALELTQQLNYVRNEVARGLLNSTMNNAQATHWLKNFILWMMIIRKNL